MRPLLLLDRDGELCVLPEFGFASFGIQCYGSRRHSVRLNRHLTNSFAARSPHSALV